MERLARVFNVRCKVKSLSKKIPYLSTKSDDPPAPDCLLVQKTIFHLQIRSFRPHPATNQTVTLNIIHLLWYFRTMISVFICTRRDKSKNTSMNANFITVKMWQQEGKHKTWLYTDHAYYKIEGDLSPISAWVLGLFDRNCLYKTSRVLGKITFTIIQ